MSNKTDIKEHIRILRDYASDPYCDETFRKTLLFSAKVFEKMDKRYHQVFKQFLRR